MKVKIKKAEELGEMYSTAGSFGHKHPDISGEEEHEGHVERSKHQGLKNVMEKFDMKLTNEQLKRIIREELQKILSETQDQEDPWVAAMHAKADAAEAAINYDVPQAAKEQIFAKMVAMGFASQNEFEGAEFWEVRPGDYGYDTDMSVEVDGKRYYGEI